MLTVERTIELVRLAKTGDKKAAEELIVNNSSLIKSVVRRFLGRGVEYDDLFQLASIGFIKAINNFDESFNVRFSTYAVPMIAGELKRFLRDDGAIKVSRIIKGLNYKIKAVVEEARRNDEDSPSVDELAEKLGVEKEDIALAIGSDKRLVSIYDKVDSEKDIEYLDTIESDEREDELIEKIMLREAIDKLNEREKKIVLLRYFSDRTQSEIAKELGVSQVQISRLETKIVENLKKKLL
ncbi:MAG TPA: RNA polymerase sigma-G factor [Clostridiales bacterium]|nr:RNA polymerase sigma-G factor [Clostridiales bacterium]